MWNTESHLDILSPTKASSKGIGLHLIELLVKGVPRTPQTTQAAAKIHGLFSTKTAPLLKATPA